MKSVHIISIMGNQGTFTKRLGQILSSAEILYHLMYIMFCVLGLCMHPFFYSVLVSYKFDNVRIQSGDQILMTIVYYLVYDVPFTLF